MIPPKCSNHLTESKKGAGRQHTTFTSCQNAACSKNCFLWWVYYILVLLFEWVNVNFAACFILRGHDTHIDFLRLLFLVGMICPLMKEHFHRPLLKRKALPLRLNKSFRLFSLLQSASWIWIAKGDILLSVNVMVSFNLCHAGPSSFSIFCTMLNFHRKWFTDSNFEEWIIGTHFVKRDFLSKKNSDP